MSHLDTPAERRDERAADRDDDADRRDDSAQHRDDDADKRDAEAAERDEHAHQDSDDLIDRVQRIGAQILDRLAALENATVDPDDWPDLTPTALARLDAHTAEQRRLARRDRAAFTALLDRLHDELAYLGRDRRLAAGDRRASARDRTDAAGNRHESAQDRDLSARDRNQAVIEREQLDPRDLASGRRE
jgi:hypothetical protein